MANMRDYLAWVKQNQQNNPEWKAANAWQNRNQTPVNKQEQKKDSTLPEGAEIVEEKPEE
jgi:hypothetical protein